MIMILDHNHRCVVNFNARLCCARFAGFVGNPSARPSTQGLDQDELYLHIRPEADCGVHVYEFIINQVSSANAMTASIVRPVVP